VVTGEADPELERGRIARPEDPPYGVCQLSVHTFPFS